TLAVAIVLDNVEPQLLTLNRCAHAGTLKSRNVDENVWLAVILFDEAETFCRVEKLYCSRSHDAFLSIGTRNRRLAACQTSQSFEIEKEDRRSAEARNKVRQQDRCLYIDANRGFHKPPSRNNVLSA